MTIRAAAFALLCLFLHCGQVCAQSTAATPDALDLEKIAPLEKVLEAALSAYNAGDAAAFDGVFAKAAHPSATARNFQAIFEGIYRPEFGKCLSKTLRPAETLPDPNFGQLAYDAAFEKRAHVKLSADFVREDGVLKIVQLRFEKM